MKKLNKIAIYGAALLLAGSSLVACNNPATSSVTQVTTSSSDSSASKIVVTITGENTVKVGASITLSATVTGYKTDSTVIWYSQNQGVATVNDGVVVGVAAGTVNIIAMSNEDKNISASFTVTVTPGTVIDDEEYVITVNAPTQVTYTIDKTKAKKGETVTLTITKVDEGFQVSGVKLNGTTITGVEGVYTFTMPNRSASIVISATAVDGDAIIAGDFSAVLKDEGNGILAARNVKVTGTAATASFDVLVKNKQGQLEKMSTNVIDETRCFADIEYIYNGSRDYAIAAGCTYDFFYDTNNIYSFYVVRTKVDVLPSDENSLYSLFDGYLRSETACRPVNVNGITFSKYQKESTSTVNIESSFKKYSDNSTYEEVIDNVKSGNKYHVYKKYDKTAKTMQVVDTFPTSAGNNDKTRETYNNHGEYSIGYDVIETAFSDQFGRDNSEQFAISKHKAEETLSFTSNMPYYAERNFMEAYRVGYSDNDELNYSDIKIKSTATADGFTVNVDTVADYNCSAGTYTSERHEGFIYDVDLDFNAAGSIRSIVYNRQYFTVDEWNFTTHQPKSGCDGESTATFNLTYSYGDPLTTANPFNAAPYFISKFDELHFFHTSAVAEDDGVTNYLDYQDDVAITAEPGSNEVNKKMAKVTFTPSTALDLYQYAPTASSDESIIAKEANDRYNAMSVVGTNGESNVTFTNHTKNTGISKTITIKSQSAAKFRSLYMMSVISWLPSGYDLSDLPESATINANATYKFYVSPSGGSSNAAPLYDATPSDSRLKITSTNKALGLDTTGFAGITETIKVKLYLSGGNYDPNLAIEKYVKIGNEIISYYDVFEFTIKPSIGEDFDIIGTWRINYVDAEQQPMDDYTDVVFTDEAYTGSVGKEYTSPKKGYLKDYVASSGKYDTFYFYYQINKGKLFFTVYNFTITTGYDYDSYSTFNIEAYYDPEQGGLGIALYEAWYDVDAYETYYFSMIGTVNDNGEVTSYPLAIKQTTK